MMPLRNAKKRVTTLATAATLAVATASLTSCSGGGSQGGPIPEHPDLNGAWVINLEQSDRPDDQLRRRDRDRPDATRRPPPQRAGPGLGELLQSFVAFRIVDQDSTFTLVSAGGARRTLYPDGAERESRLEGLGNVTVKTRWKGEKLVVERRLDSGVRISESFELTADGRQLHVLTKVSGIPQPIEFRRVYDAGQDRL